MGGVGSHVKLRCSGQPGSRRPGSRLADARRRTSALAVARRVAPEVMPLAGGCRSIYCWTQDPYALGGRFWWGHSWTGKATRLPQAWSHQLPATTLLQSDIHKSRWRLNLTSVAREATRAKSERHWSICKHWCRTLNDRSQEEEKSRDWTSRVLVAFLLLAQQ